MIQYNLDVLARLFVSFPILYHYCTVQAVNDVMFQYTNVAGCADMSVCPLDYPMYLKTCVSSEGIVGWQSVIFLQLQSSAY